MVVRKTNAAKYQKGGVYPNYVPQSPLQRRSAEVDTAKVRVLKALPARVRLRRPPLRLARKWSRSWGRPAN